MTFTTASFVRSHGRAPKGSGLWAFQASTSTAAFTADLVGDVFTANGTLTQAKAAAKVALAGASLVAVLG
jgi:hypothetical protein